MIRYSFTSLGRCSRSNRLFKQGYVNHSLNEYIGVGYRTESTQCKDTPKSKNWDFTIKKLEPNDEEATMTLLKRIYFVDEPMHRAIKLCGENGTERCLEMEEICKEELSHRTSLKAVDDDGHIISAMLINIAPVDENEPIRYIKEADNCRNEKVQRILLIYSKVAAGAKLWEKYGKEKVVFATTVVTDPAWRNKGVLSALIAAFVNMARENSIRLLRGDATNIYTAQALERHGFTCVYKAAYTDITMFGKPIILPDPPHKHYALYIKDLKEENAARSS